MALTTLTEQAIQDILNGAVILGSGGGGPMAAGVGIMQAVLAAGTPVRIADPHADVDDDDTMAVAFFHSTVNAAPDIPIEIGEAVQAFKALSDLDQARTGRDFSFILPLEVGAESMIPLAMAVQTGLPVVDGDAAGRGIITLAMNTFAAQGIPIAPIILANQQLAITLTVESAAAAAGPLWSTVGGEPFGGNAGLAFWAMDGRAMKAAIIPNTLTRARKLGAALREAKAAGEDPVRAVAAFLGATVLGVGPVVDSFAPSQDTQVGWLAIRSAAGEEIRVFNLRENLMAWDATKSAPLAMGPDLICYLTTDGQPFSNEDLGSLKPGQQVAILAAPCDPAFRIQPIIDVFMGLYRKALFYGGPYVPVEHLLGVRR